MAADGASDAMGPRYAPPDPTLPEPWKGLIDGSTGMMYYWNPDTNITQYEKPTALPPPVPSGPPPVPSAHKPASISSARTEQPNGQQAHQMYSAPEQQMTPQQSYQGVSMDNSQGYQYTHQQMPYMGYQQRPPNMMMQQQQQPQHLQQFPHQQDHRAAYSQREDAGFQPGGPPLAQNLSSDVNPMQTPAIGGQPGQATQYGGSQFNMQQPSSFGQLQQSSVDYQQHGPPFQNQMGQPLIHGQQSNVPPVGSKMGFEDNPPRGANDHYYNAKNGGPTNVSHQPKLAAIPMARSQPVKHSTFYF